MKKIIRLTERNVKEILRDPISLIFLFALPIGMQVLFYYLFHSLTPQFEMQYLAPGMIGFAHAFLALFSSMLVATDRESSFITRIYTTPVKPYEFLLGYLFAVLPFGLLQSASLLVLGGCLQPSFFSWNFVFVVLVSTLSIWMFASIGVLFGSLFGAKAVGGISSIMISGQSLLSGMWFPLEGLSDEFIGFMNVLPFRNVSILFQNVASGAVSPTFQEIWLPVIILIGYAVVCCVLACLCFLKNARQK